MDFNLIVKCVYYDSDRGCCLRSSLLSNLNVGQLMGQNRFYLEICSNSMRKYPTNVLAFYKEPENIGILDSLSPCQIIIQNYRNID